MASLPISIQNIRTDGRLSCRAASRSAVLLCAASLVLLVPLSYAPALNDYLLSDSFRLVGQIDFRAALDYFHSSSGFGRNEFRPMVPLTYAVDEFFWGGRPLGYHLTNVLLHTVNSLLMFWIFLRLTGSLLPGFAAAMLFALHPAHHSRVAWIAARDSSVCLLVLSISWLAYLRGRSGDGATGRSFRNPWRWISCGAFVLALLSYEGAVAFPFVLLAMELLVFRDHQPNAEMSNSVLTALAGALRRTIPYLVLLALYLTWWLFLFRGTVGGYDFDFSLSGMASNFYRLHYRLLYHVQHWLGLFYLLAFYWLWRERKRFQPLLGFAVALLWIGYLPFLPVRGFADRFSFLSAAGVALLLGLCASGATRIQGRASAAPILPLLLTLLFAGYYTWGTGRRQRQWAQAGEKAQVMLDQIHALRPTFPSNATLVFDQIPAMHENAYVFPTGFRAALRRRYAQELPQIFYYPAATDPVLLKQLLQQSPAYHFRYLPDEERFVEIETVAAR